MRLPPASSTTRVRSFSGTGLSSDQIEMIREKVRDEITLRGREMCWYCEHNVHHETETDECECLCHASGEGLQRAA